MSFYKSTFKRSMMFSILIISALYLIFRISTWVLDYNKNLAYNSDEGYCKIMSIEFLRDIRKDNYDISVKDHKKFIDSICKDSNVI